MPVNPTYPGVYVQELPSGVHTITGVATSITAFIGSARRGPSNDPQTLTSLSDFERIFGGLSAKSPMSYAVQQFYLNGGSMAIIVRVHKGAVAAKLPLGQSASALTLEAVNEGAWGNDLSAIVTKLDAKTFNLTVTYNPNNLSPDISMTETYLNLSVDATNPRYVPEVLATSSLVRVSGAVPDTAPDSGTYTATADSGQDGDDIDDNAIVGPGLQANKQGLWALSKVDLFNLLYIPPLAFKADGSVTDVGIATTITEALDFCEKRRAFLLVDPPSTWTSVSLAVQGITNDIPKSSYGTIYFPYILGPDPLSQNRQTDFAPGGTVAGIFARTDAQRGVWKAPAGTEASLLGASQLALIMNDLENGELNQLGVNCLRSFPVTGRVVWGARTLKGADQLADEYKYIPVRRTALFIEESLYRGLQWVIFEPNDEPLWAQIRLNVGAFMQNLFRQGAFQGQSPSEAYFVKCSKETTTQNDINLGIVNVIVGFAPLKPAEFVMVKIQQMAGQIAV